VCSSDLETYSTAALHHHRTAPSSGAPAHRHARASPAAGPSAGPAPGGHAPRENELTSKMETTRRGATAASAATTPRTPPRTVPPLAAIITAAPSQRGQPNCSAMAAAAPDAI